MKVTIQTEDDCLEVGLRCARRFVAEGYAAQAGRQTMRGGVAFGLEGRPALLVWGTPEHVRVRQGEREEQDNG